MKDRVKILRKELGFTQSEFAEKLLLTHSIISRVESGDVPLSEKNIKLICRTFDVNEDWVRNGKGDIFLKKDVRDTSKKKELFAVFDTLSPEMQDVILNMVEGLVKAQSNSQNPMLSAMEKTEMDFMQNQETKASQDFPLEPIRSGEKATPSDFEEDKTAG
jgi:transcriptional regulator with XRE-family HTH domain